MSPAEFPPLAFGVASPLLLLGGALLAAVPVVIHLLYRHRLRDQPWAAMQFLREAVRKQARRVRLEALVLLAVRTLVILFAALALAEPYVELTGAPDETAPSVQRVLVVDVSLSMSAAPGGVSALERARQIARRIVETAHPGDAFQLVRLCEAPPQVVIRRPAHVASDVLAELDRLTPTEERGDVAAVLRQVSALLTERGGLARREVVILTDLQAADWRGESETARQALRSSLSLLAASARLTFVDVGGANVENCAVTGIRAVSTPGLENDTLPVEVQIHNFGRAPAAGRTLELALDAHVVETRVVDVPAETTISVPFTVPRGESRESVVEARLSADVLPLDNRRSAVVPGRAPVEVLLVSGRRRAAGAAGATDFVALALDPLRGGRTDAPGAAPLRVAEIGDGELDEVDLRRFHCVFLCDVPLVTESEAVLLRSYVAAGGGLVVALGGDVRAANYNQQLYRDGDGLLPGGLLEVVGESEAAGDGVRFEPGEYEHPIVRPFAGNPDAGLLTTQILSYYRTAMKDGSTARIVLRYSTGDAAIIEQRVGAGRVLLVTTALDDRWGNWALWPSFVPIVHEMARFGADSRFEGRHLRVAQALSRPLSPDEIGKPVAFISPEGSAVPIPLPDAESTAAITTEPLTQAGVYRLQLGGSNQPLEHYAVNIDPAESDLARLDREQLASRLLPDTEFGYLTDWQPLAGSGGQRLGRSGLTRWFLVACLALLLVEQLLAWRFAWGFAALCAVTGAALMHQTAPGRPWLTVACGMVLVATAAVLWRRARSDER
jgi:hypothetical protein